MLSGLTIDIEAPWARKLHRDIAALAFACIAIKDVGIEYVDKADNGETLADMAYAHADTLLVARDTKQ